MNIPTSRRQLDNCITANEMWLLPLSLFLSLCFYSEPRLFFFSPHSGAKLAFLAKLICE